MTGDNTDFLDRAPRVTGGHAVEETGCFREYAVELADGTSARLFTLGPDAEEDAADAFRRVSGQWRNVNSHPNVVSVLDYDDAPRPWIAVTERPGERLETAQSRLSIADARSIVEDAAEALRNAALYNAVHLTLSPSSVWVFAADGRRRAAVGEWGLRYAVERAAGDPPTDGHLAPELLDGASGDDRTVVYGLGVVSYYALTGRYPDEHASDDADGSGRDGPAPPATVADGLPAEVDDVVLTALARDPDDRYQSSFEFKQAMSTALPAEPDEGSGTVTEDDAGSEESDAPEAGRTPADESLTVISGVGASRAADLRKAGYDSLEDLAAASTEELRAVDGVGTSLANRIKASDAVKRRGSIADGDDDTRPGGSTDQEAGDTVPGETVPTTYWWMILLLGTTLWWGGLIAGVFAFSEGTRGYEISTSVAAISWFLVPPAVYFDRKTVRKYSEWNPAIALYVVGGLSIVATGVAGLLYLRRRRNASGATAPESTGGD